MSDGSGIDRLLAFIDRLREAGEGEEETPEPLEDWVAFRVAGRRFALPVAQVREVVRVGGITRVAGAPFPVRGALNLRGRVLAVLDLGERFGLGPVAIEPEARILVLDLAGRWIGLLVAAAERLLQVAPSSVREPDRELLPAGGEAMRGVVPGGGDSLILLDGEGVVSTGEAD